MCSVLLLFFVFLLCIRYLGGSILVCLFVLAFSYLFFFCCCWKLYWYAFWGVHIKSHNTHKNIFRWVGDTYTSITPQPREKDRVSAIPFGIVATQTFECSTKTIKWFEYSNLFCYLPIRHTMRLSLTLPTFLFANVCFAFLLLLRLLVVIYTKHWPAIN